MFDSFDLFKQYIPTQIKAVRETNPLSVAAYLDDAVGTKHGYHSLTPPRTNTANLRLPRHEPGERGVRIVAEDKKRTKIALFFSVRTCLSQK